MGVGGGGGGGEGGGGEGGVAVVVKVTQQVAVAAYLLAIFFISCLLNCEVGTEYCCNQRPSEMLLCNLLLTDLKKNNNNK